MKHSNPLTLSLPFVLLLTTLLTLSLNSAAQSCSFGEQEYINYFPGDHEDVAAADIDNDGDFDVVGITIGNWQLYWYENLGGGVLSSARLIDHGTFSGWEIGLMDVDSDGFVDIVSVAKHADGRMVWYKNDGGTGFEYQSAIGSTSLRDIELADLDGDGKLDIVGSYYGAVWHKNLGGGAFGPEQLIRAESSFTDGIYTSDLDSDGDIDILATIKDEGKVVWYENLGGASFGTRHVLSTTATNTQGVSVSDINGDGLVDVLATSWDDLFWFENLGSGVFGSQQIIPSSVQNPVDIFAHDMDGDGDNDVLAVDYAYNPVSVWIENTGSGTWGPEQVLGNEASSDLDFADMDGDGQTDILIAGKHGSLVKQISPGVYSAPERFSGGLYATGDIDAMTYGDMDGDGDIDLLSLSDGRNAFNWYVNNGAGNFTQMYEVTGLADPLSLSAIDIDSDGDLDVAVSGDNYIKLYINQGMGVFTDGSVTTIGIDITVFMDGADLDADGDTDLLVSGVNYFAPGDNCFWLENTGGGVFGSTHNLNLFGYVTDIKSLAADVDMDGDLDVVSVVRYGEYSIDSTLLTFHENLGAGVFAPKTNLGLATGFGDMEIADLDGDADLDVLIAYGGVSQYENDGTGAFGPPAYIHLTSRATRLDLADLDNDGDLDVVTGFNTVDSDYVAWHENLGSGAFGPFNFVSSDVVYIRNVAAVDLEGAGYASIVSASRDDNKIAVYRNSCTSILICPKPINLTQEIEPDSITLSWDPIAGADKYLVQGRQVGTTVFKKRITVPNTITLGGLSPANYEWRVRLRCDSGLISSFSEVSNFTIPAAATIARKRQHELER